jgi:Protein of unknown function (DUF3224)
MGIVSGEFDVAMVPQPVAELNSDSGVGRMTLDKRYQGALTATGRGEFLSYQGAVPTSAVYVAIEKVEGTLEGRHGSFALQHAGVMGGEHAGLRIIVAPDTGTGELTGLRGTMHIRMEQGKHFYDFDYTLG